MVMFLLLAYLYVAIGMASILDVIGEIHPEGSLKTTDIILFSAFWPLAMGSMIAATIKHIIRNKTERSAR